MMNFPKGTISGAVLCLVAYVLRGVFPSLLDPTIVTLLGMAGAALAGFGAMAATGELAKNAPFFKLADGRVPPWPAMCMIAGIGGYLFSALAQLVGPTYYHDYYIFCTALSILAGVVGWRMWCYLLVERSKPKPRAAAPPDPA